MKYRVRIENDSDVESPADNDCQWTIYSFCSRHINFKHPEDIAIDIGLKRKLQVGTAFWLSYFEHGNCEWMLANGSKHMYDGDWQWDGVDRAGILLWEHKPTEMGAKDYEGRAKDAAGFLEEYTNWCNGECYYYSLEKWDADTQEWKDVDSCGGYIGHEYMFTEIRSAIEHDAKCDNESRLIVDDQIEVEVTGEAGDGVDADQFIPDEVTA